MTEGSENKADSLPPDEADRAAVPKDSSEDSESDRKVSSKEEEPDKRNQSTLPESEKATRRVKAGDFSSTISDTISAPVDKEANQEGSTASLEHAVDPENGKSPVRMSYGRDRTREHRRTHNLLSATAKLGVAVRSDAVSEEGEEEIEQHSNIIALLTENLDPALKRDTLDEIDQDTAARSQFRLVRQHLELHRRLKPTSVPQGSFLRLTEIMRSRGYLTYAYPGSLCLWRRSIYATLVAFLVLTIVQLVVGGESPASAAADRDQVVATFTLFDPTGLPSSEPLPVRYNSTLRTGSDTGSLWLATRRRGVANRIELSGLSEFKLIDRRSLELRSGHAYSIEVSPLGVERQGFSIATPHARFETSGARFSVEVRAGSTVVNVFEGSLDARVIGRDQATIVLAGEGAKSEESTTQMLTYSLLRVSAEQLENYPEYCRVRFVNQSAHRVRISRADGPDAYPYRLTISPDAVSQAPSSAEVDALLLSAMRTVESSVRVQTHFGDVTLEPSGSGNDRYEFLTNLELHLAGLSGGSFSIVPSYTGELHFEAIGALDLIVSQRAARLSLLNPPK